MAAHPTLITDPKERVARAQEKARRTLRFLRDECWTTTDIAARVMGVNYSTAHRTLNTMQRDHYLKSEDVVLYSRLSAHGHDTAREEDTGNGRRYVGRKVVLWGITSHGLAHAWDLEEEMEERSPFEVGRISPSYIEHHIGIQRLRLAAEAAGWQAWRAGRLLLGRKLAKVPDGIALDATGVKVAVEFEREIKTAKRYAEILGAYLVALRAGDWQRVDYVCPTSDLAARLKRIFYAIREVTHKGQKAAITPEHLNNRVTFAGLEQWPAPRAV